jgi:hypothetical protein
MRQPSRIFRGKVGNGRLWLELRDDFAKLIQTLEGKDIEVILRKQRKQRSLNQNSWYWGCIIPLLSEHCGYDAEEMHGALKERFLRDREHETNGLVKIRSSTSLDTAEFTEYVESCRRLAAEMGVVIPDPGMAA